MRAVFIEAGKVEVRDVPLPSRQTGYALIRLTCAGICNTDLELLRGYYGFSGTPGHEFVGEVVEADNPKLRGRRVTGEINLPCGECEWCRRGMGRHCPTRTVLGIVNHPGAFAEYLTLPEKNLHEVPSGVPTEHAVFAEPIAAACEVLDQVEIPAGSDVAVLGDGKLGLLIAQVLKAHGVQVHLYGHHPDRARMFGVAAGQDGRRYAHVLEATGSADGLRQAVSMTQPRGVIVMKSTVHEPVSIDMAPVIVNEISLVGSRCGRFEPALALLARGAVCVEPMISARFPLDRAPEAFARASEKGVLKVLLDS